MASNSTAVHISLDISSISLALLVLGGYVCLVGQFSYMLKEKLFISSALVSLSLGIAVGPIGANWINPLVWTGDDLARNELTYQVTRLVIGIQVMFAGISLPAAYLHREWRSLAMLLVPIMTFAWFVSAGLILAFIPGLTFLEALCISACVTPTDPILANAIVKGRYAEKHVARNVRNIISAESGANDGLGYPFIFLPILLMRRGDGSISTALTEWVVETWIYEIILSCVIGALIGFIARKTLKEAHKRQLIDHESFLAYGFGLAFLVLGVVGVLGSDDLLACFVAGNSLTWRDFYRIESEDDTFQDVIDNLLNAAIFIYVGTLLPWSEFGGPYLTPLRLFGLVVTILIFRRLPAVMALYPFIPALHDKRQALFSGWFGPVGISGIYYAMVALRELPEDRVLLRAVIAPTVYFMCLASTIAHGVTIPLTKFGPKALTRTRSSMSVASVSATHLFSRLRGNAIQPHPIGPIRVQDISAPSHGRRDGVEVVGWEERPPPSRESRSRERSRTSSVEDLRMSVRSSVEDLRADSTVPEGKKVPMIEEEEGSGKGILRESVDDIDAEDGDVGGGGMLGRSVAGNQARVEFVLPTSNT